MSYVLGLTGPTGAGKSEFSKIAKQSGFLVIDCDLISREVVKKGSEGLKLLCLNFGNDILNADKTLNRKALSKVAFSSIEKTELLNKTILPLIAKSVKEKIKGDFVLIDAPTLFESELNEICNKTVAVLADRKIRLQRIILRDKIDSEAAMLRINAGKSDKFYLENADNCFYNNVDFGTFKITVEKFINDLMKGNR